MKYNNTIGKMLTGPKEWDCTAWLLNWKRKLQSGATTWQITVDEPAALIGWQVTWCGDAQFVPRHCRPW